MRLRLPPALIFLIFAGLMYLLSKFLPVGHFDFFGRMILLKSLIVIALLIGIIALIQFGLKKTTINPAKPDDTSSLITSGLYDYSRNPMYLALLLVLLALGLYLQNAFNTLLVGGFVYYMNRFQIIPEEEVLSKKFGQEYKLYLKAVRRWF